MTFRYENQDDTLQQIWRTREWTITGVLLCFEAQTHLFCYGSLSQSFPLNSPRNKNVILDIYNRWKDVVAICILGVSLLGISKIQGESMSVCY